MAQRNTEQYPFHSAIFGKVLIDDLKSQGFSVAQISGNTGLRLGAFEPADPRVSFDAMASLFERAAELTGDDLLGFKRGQIRETRRAGLLAFLGMAAPTVGSFLTNLARYQRVYSEATEISIERLWQEGLYEWQFSVPRAVERRQIAEFGAAATLSDIRRLTGRHVRPTRVEFRHHRAGGVATIKRFYGCPVLFGSDRNRTYLKVSDLDLPLRTADEYLFRTVETYCMDALSKLGQRATDSVVAVENEIAGRLVSGDASLAGVARALGLSARTLSRRLFEEGTTFSAVVEDYRAAMAKQLIRDAGMPVTEIAYLLGYGDASAFSTAFKRWTGQTATAFRSQRTKDS